MNRPPFRSVLGDAIRYWEPRRVLYNLVLTAVVIAWFVLTWPHFRAALTLQSLLVLFVLAGLANLCYCAAYLVDIPMQCSSIQLTWRRWRAGLFLSGTVLAAVITCYWIADEIYPYVG